MPQTVEYYLSKGFDEKAAEYFSKGRRKPIKVEPQDTFCLLITFDNFEKRLFDMSSLIKENTVYFVLNDKDLFKRCYIDSNNSICWDKDASVDSEKVWSNKIDLGADTCYMESKTVE